MTKEQEKQYDELLKKNMQLVRDTSLIAGVKTACGVVLEKAKDSKKIEKERLKDIIAYCERSIGVADKNGV